MSVARPRVPTSVGIIDIGIANLGSIERTLSETAEEVIIINKPGQVDSVDRLVIPGVGAYPTAMTRLETTGLDVEILRFSEDRRRAVLGICLGMQLLSSSGEEHEMTQGLGLIEGHVRRFCADTSARVPHVGWTSVSFTHHTLFDGIEPETDFYFVHSYVFEVSESRSCIATAVHGERFSAAVATDNVAGVQFHPEKSSRAGRVLLKNFCEWSPC